MKTISYDPTTEAVIVLKKDPKASYIAGNKNHPLTIMAGGFLFMNEIDPGLQCLIAMYINYNRAKIYDVLEQKEVVEWTFKTPKVTNVTCQ